MDNLDDSENNAKVSDSVYSSSNSQSRRSHSSKSTHSGSHSSQSSGYGGKQSLSGSSNPVNQHAGKISIEKNGKNKIKGQTELEQIQTNVEFRLPDPAPFSGVKKEVHEAFPGPTTLPQSEMNNETMDIATEMDQCENTVANHTSHSQMQVVLEKTSSLESFSCVIAMHDGIVLYTTSSLTSILGYPRNMWIGRSFMEFVHPLDHSTFASQMTSGFAAPENANGVHAEGQPLSNSGLRIFCRLRRYKGLHIGFSVTETACTYMPLKLNLSFKNFNDENGLNIYMVVEAMPLLSAFKTAHEMVVNPEPFFMRHLSNGILEYIDPKSVAFLGYLPQDIVGKDILHLYHPDDLVYVKQIYETIAKAGGAPRTKPYRLMAQNGQYLNVESEWSSFVNPWTRKLEFVVGKHHVVQGPAEPDVFLLPLTKVSTEDTRQTRGLKDSILRVMDNALTEPAEIARQQMTKRCQDLASYMENLIKQPPKQHDELSLNIQEPGNSCFERDSVMLGEISPHHDNGDCNSSTTPLSYNQLNFNENLQRYFDRHQANSYEEYLHDLGGSIAPITASKQSFIPRRCLSPMAEYSGDSAELTSSGESTVAVINKSCRRSSSARDYQAPLRLTESLLNRHNSEMEKSLVMQHREGRVSSKECRDRATTENKQNIVNHLGRCNAYSVPTPADLPVKKPQLQHGVKRAYPLKAGASAPKHHCPAPHVFSVPNAMPAPSCPVTAAAPQCHSSSDPMNRFLSCMTPDPVTIMNPMAAVPAAPQWQSSSNPPMNLYSSSLTVQPVSIMNPLAAVPGLIPAYYVPPAVPTMLSYSEPPPADPSILPQFQPPRVVYGQPVFVPPVMVSTVNPQMHHVTPQYAAAQTSLELTTSNYELSLEPVAKAKTARVLKKNGNRLGVSDVERTDGESSYSSLYSSFFETEGSGEDSDAKKGRYGSGDVCVTSTSVYNYQIITKSMEEVLLADKEKLALLTQPPLVNEQLGQLYMEMELEGTEVRLMVEEGITSSSSSGGETGTMFLKDDSGKRIREKRESGRLWMMYDDAPLPSPGESNEPAPSSSLS